MDLPDNLVVFDTESTGVDVFEDRIVTAFMGVVKADGSLIYKRSWLIDPEVEIPEGATAIHGVTTEYAREYGMLASRGIGEIITALNDYKVFPLVVFNAPFDLTLLNAEAERWNLEPYVPNVVIDPLVIDKAIDKYRKGKRTLTAMAERYGVEWVGGAHDAQADSIVAGKLAYRLLADLNFQQAIELYDGDFMAAQAEWKAEQAESYQSYLRDKMGQEDAVINGEWPIQTSN